MFKLKMELWEILQDYRTAKDKDNMITVLADRNICERKDIIEILEANGGKVEIVEKKKKVKIHTEPPSVCDIIDVYATAKALNLYKISLQKDRSEILKALKALEEEFAKVEKTISAIHEIIEEREAE